MFRSWTVFALVSLFFVVRAIEISDVPENKKSFISNNSTNRINYRFPRKWIADMFYETLSDFSISRDVGSSACQRQTLMYIQHLKNDSYWAVQMSDSWSRYPNGILAGTTHQMGVYNECLDVHQPVQGKYCIPAVKFSSMTGEDLVVSKPVKTQSNDHAWHEILGFVDKDKEARRNIIKFGICIPDSCTASDLEISLQKEFDKTFLPQQVKARVNVESILCSTDKDMFPFDTGYYLTSSLGGLLFLTCFLSTAYHFIIQLRSNNGKKTYKLPEIFGYFSIIRNGRDLIKYDKNNDLNIFNGLKVLTMILVLFGHKFLYFVINPLVYSRNLERMYEIGPDFLFTCMNLVDPFFYITGYLMYVLLIPQFSKPGTNWLQIPMVVIYKYLRVLPAYLVMMIMTAFIIPHLGDGPFWASRMWPEADKCKTYWWTNLLAVSNFIKVENQCLIAGWYVSCMLQFLVIGTVVMYIHVKNRKLGTYLIVLLLCASLIIPIVITYVNHAYGIVRLMYSFLEHPSNSFEYNYFYRPFYFRAIPFFAGLVAGIVVEELKKRKVTFSTPVVYIGTVLVTIACFWIQMHSKAFYDESRPYNLIEQSLYASISHCTWTIILFCATVCHYVGGYGPVEKIFNNRFVVPLGRLSYSVYLVNITVMMMIESRQKASVYPTGLLLVDGWILGAVRTYLMGILLYLTVEVPFGLLIKKMLYGKNNSYNSPKITNPVDIRTETEPKESTNL